MKTIILIFSMLLIFLSCKKDEIAQPQKERLIIEVSTFTLNPESFEFNCKLHYDNWNLSQSKHISIDSGSLVIFRYEFYVEKNKDILFNVDNYKLNHSVMVLSTWTNTNRNKTTKIMEQNDFIIRLYNNDMFNTQIIPLQNTPFVENQQNI
jgi:hypothetical protein